MGCIKAAKTLNKYFSHAAAWGNWPKGCFVSNGLVYHNKHKTGKGNKNAKPVCVENKEEEEEEEEAKKEDPKKKEEETMRELKARKEKAEKVQKKPIIGGKGQTKCPDN